MVLIGLNTKHAMGFDNINNNNFLETDSGDVEPSGKFHLPFYKRPQKRITFGTLLLHLMHQDQRGYKWKKQLLHQNGRGRRNMNGLQQSHHIKILGKFIAFAK